MSMNMAESKLHSGHYILIGAVGSLVFIFILLYLFMQGKVSIVTQDYYGQELHFNERQEAIHRTMPFDSLYKAQIVNGRLELTIPQTINNLLEKGEIQVYCPSGEVNDAVFHFLPSVSNIYTFDKPRTNNNCVLKIMLRADSKDYYREVKI